MVEVTEALLKRLYIEEGKSLREIGLLYGRSTKWAYTQLIKFNIPRRSFSTKGIKLTPEWREKVIKTLKFGLSGKDNPNWKGGKTINDKGYVLIRKPEDPNAHQNGYREEHRIVIESFLGRPLKEKEEIHHLNGNKRDNRLENLMILSPEDHARIHTRKNKFWEKRR